jgi:hypothetical protein
MSCFDFDVIQLEILTLVATDLLVDASQREGFHTIDDRFIIPAL